MLVRDYANSDIYGDGDGDKDDSDSGAGTGVNSLDDILERQLVIVVKDSTCKRKGKRKGKNKNQNKKNHEASDVTTITTDTTNIDTNVTKFRRAAHDFTCQNFQSTKCPRVVTVEEAGDLLNIMLQDEVRTEEGIGNDAMNMNMDLDIGMGMGMNTGSILPPSSQLLSEPSSSWKVLGVDLHPDAKTLGRMTRERERTWESQRRRTQSQNQSDEDCNVDDRIGDNHNQSHNHIHNDDDDDDQRFLDTANVIVWGFESDGIPSIIDKHITEYVQVQSRTSVNVIAAVSILLHVAWAWA